MDLRRKIVVAVFLVATGVAAGVVFHRPIIRGTIFVLTTWRGCGVVGRVILARGVATAVGASRDLSAEQVRLDAISLLDVVRPDPRLPADLTGQEEFWRAWDARRARYAPERLADLRTRLHDYLDFLQAEHADCSEIWVTGRRPQETSDAAREARRRVTAGFGAFAEATLLPQADALREEAYRASPRVAGYDPDLPDYREEYEALQRWIPAAHRRVVELTEPVAGAPR